MRTIGLTGGIGSGKSTVAAMLAKLGAIVIDADRIGHEVYAPGKPAWSAVVDAFGRDVVAGDGSIDRKRLAARVFSDPAALARLNALLHPRMADEIRRRIDELRARGGREPVVLEAAVLLEAGWDALVDETWVVVAPTALRVERVSAERGADPAEVERRIRSQMSDEERQRRADLVIRNGGSRADLEAGVAAAWRARFAGDAPARPARP